MPEEVIQRTMEAEGHQPLVYVSPREYREIVAALGGNAKARRRWRRRNVPNTQHERAKTAAAWSKAIAGTAAHFETWAPVIWAGVVPVASVGVAGEPTMRITNVDREARTITMETLP